MEANTWEEQDMNERDSTLYRAIVARCNFLSLDRPDFLYASKECSSEGRRIGQTNPTPWKR